jgi:hypothetical protein
MSYLSGIGRFRLPTDFFSILLAPEPPYSRHPNLPIRIARCGNRSTKPDGPRVMHGSL